MVHLGILYFDVVSYCYIIRCHVIILGVYKTCRGEKQTEKGEIAMEKEDTPSLSHFVRPHGTEYYMHAFLRSLPKREDFSG